MSFTYAENAAGDPDGQYVATRDDGTRYVTDGFGGELWEVALDGTRFKLKAARQFYAEDLQDFQAKLAGALGIKSRTAITPGRVTNQQVDAQTALARRAAKVTRLSQIIDDDELFRYMAETEPGRVNALFAGQKFPPQRSSGHKVIVAQNRGHGKKRRHDDLLGTAVLAGIAAPIIVGNSLLRHTFKHVMTPQKGHRGSR